MYNVKLLIWMYLRNEVNVRRYGKGKIIFSIVEM